MSGIHAATRRAGYRSGYTRHENEGGGLTLYRSDWAGFGGPFSESHHFYYPIARGYADSHWDNSANGASFKFQDKVYGTNCGGADSPTCIEHNSSSGRLEFNFKKLPGGCLQIFTQYAHTWDTTDITGFGISWRNEGHDWQLTSPAARVDC
jgi:hypothetical protein